MRALKSEKLVSIYEKRIGESTTEDEAMGYWLFVVGVLIGFVGVSLILASSEAGQAIRGVGDALAAVALVLILVGQIVRLPLTKKALPFLYGGSVLCAGAIVWFLYVYPEGWSLTFASNEVLIIGMYGFGTLLITVAGIVTPLLTSPVEERDAAIARAEEAELKIEELHNSQSQFELYEDKSGKYRWRLRHRNGNIIADGSQGYSSKQKAKQGMAGVRRDAVGAAMIDFDLIEREESEDEEPLVVEAESQSTFESYEDKSGKYRWRLKHKNGNIIADSSQGYANKSTRDEMIDRVREYVLVGDYYKIDPVAFEIYRDNSGKYRWRLVHKNGKIMGSGGQSYSSRQSVINGIDSVVENTDEDNFEVYEDKSGKYRWRLNHNNGNIIAVSTRSFDSESSVEDALDRVQNNIGMAERLEFEAAMFEVYEDNSEKYRWRLRHENGNIMADSGQGYSKRSKAVQAINSVKRDVSGANLVSED